MTQDTAPTSSVELVATREAPSRARHHSRATLREWGMSDSLVEAVELVVSELVTNAVQHASRRPPALTATEANAPDPYEIVVTLVHHPDGVLRIEVSDWDPTPPSFSYAPRYADHGRGLLIVGALAKEWGCLHPIDGGKVVWCNLSEV